MAALGEECEGNLHREGCRVSAGVCRTHNERKDNQCSRLVSRTQPGGYVVEQREDSEGALDQNGAEQLCGHPPLRWASYREWHL